MFTKIKNQSDYFELYVCDTNLAKNSQVPRTHKLKFYNPCWSYYFISISRVNISNIRYPLQRDNKRRAHQIIELNQN